MPTPPKGARLGGSPAHERLILGNLATSLFEHGRITTTVTKAKRLQPFAERLVSKAKRGDLHSVRQIAKVVHNKTPRRPDEPGDANTILHRLVTEIAPAMADRQGGYTRITKVGNRKGDNAPMAVIELILEPVSPKQAVVREAEKAAKKSAPKAEKAEAKPADETASDETSSDEKSSSSED
jgi:large subunit ribosomal protein L17